MKKTLAFLLAVLMVGTLLAGCGNTQTAAPATEAPSTEAPSTEAPTEVSSASSYSPGNITVVVPYKAGGGIDILGRTVLGVMSSEGITDAVFTYENTPGASGQVGLGVAHEQYAGDDHMLLPISSTYTILNEIQGADYSYKDFVLLGAICSDPNMFVVNSKLDVDSLDDLVAVSQERQLVFAISGVGSIAHVLCERAIKELGLNARVLPYDGDSEMKVALLAGDVDVTVFNVAECIEYFESGDLKPLAVTTAERLEAFPDVPTCLECGTTIKQMTMRGFAMAPGVSQEAIDYWVDKIKEVSENQALLDTYVNANSMISTYMTPEEFRAALDAEYEVDREILTDLGMAVEK